MDIGEGIKTVYFIGIGGIHMSGYAMLLKAKGFNVRGSDRDEKAETRMLRAAGVEVFIGHNADNITDDIDLVVYTVAVKADNPELVAAKNAGIPMYERAKMLGLIMRNYKNAVCVAGVHGKTTVTSMISEIFMEAGLEPTIMNGGVLPSIGCAWRDGGDEYFIAEACEYYDGFLKLYPTVGIILNIELDHTDYFPSLAAMRGSFANFAGLIPDGGTLIINGSHIDLHEDMRGETKPAFVTFGNCGNWRAVNVKFDERGCGSFDALHMGDVMGRVELGVIGNYNIDNALAALACAHTAGVGFDAAARALARFTGAARRFEYKGTVNGVKVYDDYAHHPTAVGVTLGGVKNCEYGRLYVVFQPHTHTRTKELLNEFAGAFDDADTVILTDIYVPAGRAEDKGAIHSTDLADKIRRRGKETKYFADFGDVKKYLEENCAEGDLILTMGAGDVYKIAEMLITC